MKIRPLSSVLASGLAFLLLIQPLAIEAQQAAGKATSVAVLDIANAGLDPRVDYLSGIIGGLLSFDLGSRPGIALVDRRNMDAVLREKELSLSALGSDASAAAAAGRLVGADWLLTGEYVFMGSDVLVTLSLTDAASAARVVFRDRGADENLVHRLAEQLVRRLTGESASFVEKGRSRSLVSLRDETPGSVALFSPIIRAEVFLDGEFVGYTTGDVTVPFVIDGVSPGEHSVRVHLDRNFGVVDLPAVTFRDWEGRAKVESGKRAVLRDETRHFNDTLYSLIQLGAGSVSSKDADAEPGSSAPGLAFAKSLSFQDRSGASVDVKVEARSRDTAEGIAIEMILSCAAAGAPAKSASLSISMERSKYLNKEAEAEAGIVLLDADLQRRSDSWVLKWRVERSDISQNMW